MDSDDNPLEDMSDMSSTVSGDMNSGPAASNFTAHGSDRSRTPDSDAEVQPQPSGGPQPSRSSTFIEEDVYDQEGQDANDLDDTTKDVQRKAGLISPLK